MSTIRSVPTTELASGPIDLTVVEPEGLYEVVNGKVVEKPAMGVYETHIASALMCLLGHFIRSNRLGNLESKCSSCSMRPTTSSAGRTSRLSLMSDGHGIVLFPERPPGRSSPTWPSRSSARRTSPAEVIVKVGEYFRSGVRSVWVVYPVEEQVYVYDSPTSVRILTRSDRLELPDILPGFRLPLESLLEAESGGE